MSVFAFAGCNDSRPSHTDLKAQLEQKLAGAQPGEERQIEPGTFMTMFRSQATVPLPDGWQLATSTKGGFSIEIPLPFNDFRMRAQAEDHVELLADTIGAKSPGLLSWIATCATRADGAVGLPSSPMSGRFTSVGTPQSGRPRPNSRPRCESSSNARAASLRTSSCAVSRVNPSSRAASSVQPSASVKACSSRRHAS